ncbi:MAG TPA: ATP-binding protein [Vicinamibacterales bacterium]|jgi:heavy metal sensor kinase|nr:ATP-binding protein [Vicinamibacterales bacterium]
MRPLSLRARLTVWYTLALLVVLSLFGANVLWQQGRIGLRRVDRELDGLNATIVNVLRDELNEIGNAALAARQARLTVAAPGRAIAILDDRGIPLAATWNGLTLPESLPDAQAARIWTATTSSGAWRVHARPQTFGPTTLVLLIASPLTDVLRERREVQEAMWIGIPIAIVLAAAGGLWLASVGLHPITDMASRAGRIPLTGMEDLGQSDRRDELGQLARAFNGLVARLRAALQTQRQFMADASHELRTPVSVIRSAADVTLGREHREESEYREALSIVDGQARRVGRLVDDMLVLARADAGGYPLRPVHLYFDDLVAECSRTLELLARERGVALQARSPGELPMSGDEDLLRRMLLNIVQNAIHYTRSGGAVTIDAEPSADGIVVSVSDQGPGIPAAERQRIFDRFVQLDPARRASGSGLGLPIARWIAEAHGGSLSLTASSAAGSTFTVILPRSS